MITLELNIFPKKAKNTQTAKTLEQIFIEYKDGFE